jgi:hypothetical protein
LLRLFVLRVTSLPLGASKKENLGFEQQTGLGDAKHPGKAKQSKAKQSKAKQSKAKQRRG